MPREPYLTDLDLIMLSTASARDDGHLYPLKASIASRTEDVAIAVTALLKRRLVETIEVDPGVMWRTEGDASIGLIITQKGRAVIDGAGIGIAGEEMADAPTSALPRKGSKGESVLALLGRKEGASSAELIDATGWLPHSMRAALTGLRRKGHAIERGLRGDLNVYRLAVGHDRSARWMVGSMRGWTASPVSVPQPYANAGPP